MFNKILPGTTQEKGIEQAYSRHAVMYDTVKTLRETLIEMGALPTTPNTTGNHFYRNDFSLYSLPHSTQIMFRMDLSDRCEISSSAWAGYKLELRFDNPDQVDARFSGFAAGDPNSQSGTIKEQEIEGLTIKGKADPNVIYQLAKWCLVGPQKRLSDSGKSQLNEPNGP